MRVRFSTENTMTIKIDQVESHADAQQLLQRVTQMQSTGATLAVRRPATTYADLLTRLDKMTAQDLTAPVSAEVAFQGSYLTPPACTLTQIGLHVGEAASQNRTVLHLTTTGLAIPRHDALAIYTCQIMGFALTEEDSKWRYSTNGSDSSTDGDFPDKESAAVAAVRAYFTFSDWKIEVAHGDTIMGYFEWALREAMLTTKAEALCA